MHVSTHKVDCVSCHLEIEHGRPANPAAAAVSPGAGGCESCHGTSHSPQASLYAGVGGAGVPRMPSPMFAAGVKCEGCHNPEFSTAAARGDLDIAPSAHALVANEVSCMACHGPGYLGIYRAWRDGVAARTAALRAQLAATAGAMGSAPPPAWLDARQNYLLVERGRGLHNVSFAYALLDRAHDQMNEARKARGLAPLALPWTRLAASGAPCLTCHQGVEHQSGKFAGHAFPHAPHLQAAQLPCLACHRPHEERAPGEVVRFGPDGCMPCHHQSAQVTAPLCAKCHADVTRRTVRSFRGEFSHKAHLDTGLECEGCHQVKNGDPRPQKSACQSCHAD
jgi:predicted CXXCH cytochrome family protein